MFRVITFLLCFLSILISIQVVNTVYDHYSTSKYIEAEATVVKNDITHITQNDLSSNLNNSNEYHVSILYKYSYLNNNYNSTHLQNNFSFNKEEEAKSFSAHYYVGKNISVYVNYQDPSISTVERGLNDNDYTKIFLLIPLFFCSLLCFNLAFILNWNLIGFNQSMDELSSGLFGGLLSSIVGSFIIIFQFNSNLDSYFRFLFLMIYIVTGLGFYLYRKFQQGKTVALSKQRYKRLYNTKTHSEEEGSFNQIFNHIKYEALFPFILLNLLFGLCILYLLIQYNFLLSKTIPIFFVIDVLFISFYFMDLLRKEDFFNHKTTTIS